MYYARSDLCKVSPLKWFELPKQRKPVLISAKPFE